jgi:hypothetical protein
MALVPEDEKEADHQQESENRRIAWVFHAAGM